MTIIKIGGNNLEKWRLKIGFFSLKYVISLIYFLWLMVLTKWVEKSARISIKSVIRNGSRKETSFGFLVDLIDKLKFSLDTL